MRTIQKCYINVTFVTNLIRNLSVSAGLTPNQWLIFGAVYEIADVLPRSLLSIPDGSLEVSYMISSF